MIDMIRQAIVVVLYFVCETLDRIPLYSFYNRRWYWRGELGCFLHISRLAIHLDDKWTTEWIEKNRPHRGTPEGESS